MHGLFSALFFALALLLGACASSDVAPPGARLSVPDTTSAITSGDLRIGPMDIVEVSVFGVPDLDNAYQVDFEGNIRMPLVGEIPAKGFTAIELARRIETALAESYLRDPSVNVVIEESVGQRVTVDGSVEKPGLYAMEGRMTLLQAVASAGGPSDAANPRKVVVFRTIEGERQAAGFNLELIREGEAHDPEVFGNDIIVVDGSEARRAYGDIVRAVPVLALFLGYGAFN